MFLYVPDQAESTASNAPRFTASLNDNRDDWCFGFDSEQLAAALNITTDSLFQANRHRKLTLENVEASTPDGEMALIKRYTAVIYSALVLTWPALPGPDLGL